jgi:hypothetical protein
MDKNGGIYLLTCTAVKAILLASAVKVDSCWFPHIPQVHVNVVRGRPLSLDGRVSTLHRS